MENRTELRFYRFVNRFIIAVAGLVAFQIGLGFLNIARNRSVLSNAKYYSSESELRDDFERERKKLGLEDFVINLEVVEKGSDYLARFFRKPDGSYTIQIENQYMNDFFLNHELKHVRNRENCPKWLYNFAPFSVFEEWNSTSYAIQRSKEKSQEK